MMPLWRRPSIERKRKRGSPKLVESCVYMTGNMSALSAGGAFRCAHASCCTLYQQDVPRIRIRMRHGSVVTNFLLLLVCRIKWIALAIHRRADLPMYSSCVWMPQTGRLVAHVSPLPQNFDCSAMLYCWSGYGSDMGVVDRDLRLYSSRRGIVCNMGLLPRFRIPASPAVGCAASDEEASCMSRCDTALRSASMKSYRPSACALLTAGVALFVFACLGRCGSED